MAGPDPTPSFWRRVAELAGIDDEIDAISAAARIAGTWVSSQLPAPTPTPQGQAQPFTHALAAREAEHTRHREALWAPFAEPLRQFGQHLYEHYAPAWTPSPDVKSLVDLARQRVAAQSAPLRQALPQPSVHWTGSGALRGLEADVNPLQPLDWATAAATDWIPNLALGMAEDASTPVGALSNLDLPVGPAAKTVASLASTLPPGFFSRVDRIAESVGKKGIHPNKLASLLKSGASSEEVAYRNLPDLITRKGNELISREELASHLAAHPPPTFETTVLGEKHQPKSFEDWLRWRAEGGMRADPEDPALRARYNDYTRNLSLAKGPTKYGQYTLPGGEAYRETLLQLPTRKAKQGRYKVTIYEDAPTPEGRSVRWTDDNVSGTDVEQLRQRYNDPRYSVEFEEVATPVGEPYRTSHFDQPNILVHARSKERVLPPSGALVRTQDEVDDAIAAGVIAPDEAARYAVGPGARGRFLEEVQSDWHQAGKRGGYKLPGGDQQFLDAQRALYDAGEARRAYATDFYQRYDAENLKVPSYEEWLEKEITPEYRGPQYERENRAVYNADIEGGRHMTGGYAIRRQNALDDDPTYRNLRMVAQHMEARLREIQQQTQGRVPDAPFKETWPDLALKQQLLDVAHRRDLSWLGFTSGRTQAERYDLSKQVSRIEYDPRERRLLAYDRDGERVISEHAEPEELADYIGKEPAEKLAEQINRHEQARAWERGQWSVAEDPDNPGAYLIHDPNGEVVHDIYGDPEQYRTRQFAEERIDDMLSQESPQNYGPLPNISGLDLQVGGEGMTSFYDQLLPARLNKLLKPFGGQVERGSVPVPHDNWIEETPGWSVRDNFGHQRGWWPTRAEAEAYLASPPPEMTSYVSAEGGSTIVPAVGAQTKPRTVDEPAWIARLSPEVKARIRQQGFPLLSLAPFAAPVAAAGAASALGGEEGQDDPSQALPFAAGVAPITLGGRRPVGELARTLRYLGGARYALKPAIIERLTELYDVGRGLTPKATWGGTQHPELLQAFGGDPELARQWARFFGTTSAGTSVPKNTQESIATLTHALDRPGVPFEATEFAPDVHGRLRPRLGLYGITITNAESKLPSLNRALAGLDPSGPKTEAMAQFMYGRPRSPIDRHVLWGLGSADDTLAAQHGALKDYMLAKEGLAPRELNEHKVYTRYEGALRDAIQGLAPRRGYNALFGDVWEGARAAKGEPYQGGPIDILRSRGLLGPDVLTDPDRLKFTLRDTAGLWTAQPPTASSRIFDLGRR